MAKATTGQAPADPAKRAVAEPLKPSAEVKKSLPIKERIRNMWNTVKYLFRFYLNGVKQIWRNRERVQLVREDLRKTGRDMTYEEGILIQRLKIRKRFEVQREASIKDVRAIMEKNPALQPPYREQEAHVTLSAVPSEGVKKLVAIYNLSAVGGTTYMRARLVKHMLRLRDDDTRLAASDLPTAPNEEKIELIADACTERGMYVAPTYLSRAVNISAEAMCASLREWLDHTQVETVIPDLELVLLPTRITERGDSETKLLEEVKRLEERSVSAKASEVVEEVVEEEKKNDTGKPRA